MPHRNPPDLGRVHEESIVTRRREAHESEDGLADSNSSECDLQTIQSHHGSCAHLTLSWREYTHPLRGEPASDDTFEHRSRSWATGTLDVPRREPTNFTVGYTGDWAENPTNGSSVRESLPSHDLPEDRQMYALTETRLDGHSRIRREDREKRIKCVRCNSSLTKEPSDSMVSLQASS